MDTLTIEIPDKNNYYSLYADGLYSSKRYINYIETTKLTYTDGAAIFLYYTYPAYRRVCLVRNTEGAGGILLPSLSKKVQQLWALSASRVDAAKRAVYFLNENFYSAYNFGDDFYIRLYFLLLERSRVDYIKLRRLAELYPGL